VSNAGGLEVQRRRRATQVCVLPLGLVVAASVLIGGGASSDPLSSSTVGAAAASSALTALPPIDPAKVINVAKFGTKGDGVTSDRKAIQAAIDSAKPGNRLL